MSDGALPQTPLAELTASPSGAGRLGATVWALTVWALRTFWRRRLGATVWASLPLTYNKLCKYVIAK